MQRPREEILPALFARACRSAIVSSCLRERRLARCLSTLSALTRSATFAEYVAYCGPGGWCWTIQRHQRFQARRAVRSLARRASRRRTRPSTRRLVGGAVERVIIGAGGGGGGGGARRRSRVGVVPRSDRHGGLDVGGDVFVEAEAVVLDGVLAGWAPPPCCDEGRAVRPWGSRAPVPWASWVGRFCGGGVALVRAARVSTRSASPMTVSYDSRASQKTASSSLIGPGVCASGRWEEVRRGRGRGQDDGSAIARARGLLFRGSLSGVVSF